MMIREQDKCRWRTIARNYQYEGYQECKGCTGFDTSCDNYYPNKRVADSLDKLNGLDSRDPGYPGVEEIQ